jgi:CheY-like chemotaxis protein
MDNSLFHANLTKPVRQTSLLRCLAELLDERNDNDESAAEPDKETPLRGHLPVLVAEDNPVNQIVAKRMLETLGYDVEVVENGVEAVQAVSTGAYALVLMDCQMPELDGYEATRQLRSRETGGRRIPIIAMTAGAMEGDAARCYEAGMDDYISKPVSLERLQQALDQALQNQRPA